MIKLVPPAAVAARLAKALPLLQSSRWQSSAVTPVVTLKHLLFYDYVDDVLERRDTYRSEHFQLAEKYCNNGMIEQAGAYQNPVDGATFLFSEGTSRLAIEKFVLAFNIHVT